MRAERVLISCILLSSTIFAAPAKDIRPMEQKFNINQLLPRDAKDVFGLKDLLEKAERNYQLIAKNDGIAKSEAEKMAAYLEFGPTVSAQYDYQYQTTPSVVGNYYGNNSASVRANWEIYSGFSTINKVRQKSALYRASIAERDYARQNLYLQIIQQYYTYFTNYSNLVSLQQKKKLLESNVERLQKLFTSGLTTVDDVESLKAEASLTDYQIAQKELEVEQNRLNLSLLTNSRITQIKRDELRYPNVRLRKERADIVMLKEQAEGIGYQRKQLSYAPKISVYNAFSYNDTFGDTYLKPEHKIQNTVGVSVSIMLDSFSLFKQKEAIGLSQMQALKELAYKQEEQKKDISFYKKSLDIAKIKVKSAEAGLKSAMLTFENVSKRYDAQLVNYVDYLNALSQKFNAQATYVESLNNYELQKANFVFYSGQDLKAYVR